MCIFTQGIAIDGKFHFPQIHLVVLDKIIIKLPSSDLNPRCDKTQASDKTQCKHCHIAHFCHFGIMERNGHLSITLENNTYFSDDWRNGENVRETVTSVQICFVFPLWLAAFFLFFFSSLLLSLPIYFFSIKYQ